MPITLTDDDRRLFWELERRNLGGRKLFSDTWDFLSHCVFTKDEASGTIRQFPSDARFEYLHYLTNDRPNHRVRAYEKSRRMLITWWLLAIYLHDIMVNSNHLNAVASDKLEKSAYLLGGDRMQFIYDHIPPVSPERLNVLRLQGVGEDLIAKLAAPVWPNKPDVVFEAKQGNGWKLAKCSQTGSSCMAIASGAAQTQQYTFSNVLMDEFPRWQWQEESWRNIQPTTQGGGCVDIVCTAELGAFAHELLYDEDS